jgi:hypothetical protein
MSGLPQCPLCAKSGHYAAQQNATYSITSLAIESISGEIFLLSTLAVLRLMRISNFVDSCYWQIAWLFTFKNPPSVGSGSTI